MRILVIVLGVLALAGIAALVLFSGDGFDPVSRAPGDAGGAPVPGPGDDRPAPVAQESGNREEAPPAIVTKAFTPPRERIVVVGGRRVRVVLAETQAPVPGAVVGFLDPDSVGPAMLLDSEHGILDLEGHVERHGAKFQADQDGIVMVPNTGEQTLICAQTETHFGVATIKPMTPDPIVLTLERIGRGTIQVVDARGSPVAGVPVVVSMDMGGMMSLVLWRGTTQGRSGRVQVRNLDQALHMMKSDENDVLTKQPLSVTTGFPLASPPAVRLEDRRFPAEPVVLRLPETGRIAVRVTRPRDREIKVNLHAGAAAFMGMVGMEGAFNPAHSRRMTENGRAVFRFVGLGLDLQLQGVDPTGILESHKIDLKGPVVAGQEVEIELALEKRAAVLSGRVVDVEGRPLGGRVFTVVANPLESNRFMAAGASRVHTGPDGKFSLPLDGKQTDRGASGPFILSNRKNLHSIATEIEQQGEVAIGGPYPAGETDIGEIVMRDVPLAITGSVLDTDDRPLVGVLVRAIPNVKDEQPDQAPVVLATRVLSVLTDELGRFEIRSPQRAGKLDLTWFKAGYCAESGGSEGHGSATHGDREVVFRLMRAGAVTGSVLLDEGIPHDAVRIELRDGSRAAVPRADFTFKLDNLKPGMMRLDVIACFSDGSSLLSPATPMLAEGEEPEQAEKPGLLLALTGVRVQQGRDHADPRIQKIDLRGRLSRYDIKVVDEQGEPLEGAWLNIKEADPGQPMKTGSGGKTRIISHKASLKVQVVKPGYETTDTALVPGDSLVTMRRGYEVRLSLASTVKAPGGTFWLMPSLKHEDGSGGELRPDFRLGTQVTPQFTSAWKSVVAPERPGRYHLKLMVIGGFENPETMLRATIEEFEPRIVEVVPGQHRTNVEIMIPPAVLEKVLEGSK